MVEHYYTIFSSHLGTDVPVLVSGHYGYPVILFPTSLGKFDQNKDFGLIDSVSHWINEGKIKIYSVGTFDAMTFYNEDMPPAMRMHNYTLYDRFLSEELAPRILHETNNQKLGVAGCSFGGYHAANFAFRHPEKTKYLMSMGGAFDIKPRLSGFYSDDVYFNNPPDFLPDATHPDLWQMHIALGSSDHDFCKNDNVQLSQILQKKNINHWLDIRKGLTHDWPAWKMMFPDYIYQLIHQ